jgi:hypothetical protein
MNLTLSLAYNREEIRWGFIENMVLRRKLGPKREQVKWQKKFIMRFMKFNVQQIFSVCLKKGGWDILN